MVDWLVGWLAGSLYGGGGGGAAASKVGPPMEAATTTVAEGRVHVRQYCAAAHVCRPTASSPHLDDLHLGQGQTAGGHCHPAVARRALHARMVVRVTLVAGVTDHVHFICNTHKHMQRLLLDISRTLHCNGIYHKDTITTIVICG